MSTLLNRIDHLVYGTLDLEATINHLEKKLGVRAVFGGRHPGWGTQNYLLSLGATAYFEIIGPDDTQDGNPGLFGLDKVTQPGLLTWAAKESDIGSRLKKLANAGITFGDQLEGSRAKTDGTLLSWALTNPFVVHADGIVPFLIDWKDSVHPAGQTPKGCILQNLILEHPEAEQANQLMQLLDIDIVVKQGAAPRISAVIDCPAGQIILT
jgi:hypothetical protein